MFTGIVEEMGSVLTSHQDKDTLQWILTILGNTVLQGVAIGDSIAVNGVCLTVTTFNMAKKTFTVGLSPETLRKTELGRYCVPNVNGKACNLERSMTGATKIGGHWVQGHVDDVGTIIEMTPEKDSLWVKVQVPETLMQFIVNKGYICVDGASLTVCETGQNFFNFMMIQHTQKHVITSKKKVGDKVNVEADVMGKYINKYIQNFMDRNASSMRSKL